MCVCVCCNIIIYNACVREKLMGFSSLLNQIDLADQRRSTSCPTGVDWLLHHGLQPVASWRDVYIVISPFFGVVIFLEGTRYPKICYSNIVPLRTFFSSETFSHMDISGGSVNTRGVNSGTRCEHTQCEQRYAV